MKNAAMKEASMTSASAGTMRRARSARKFGKENAFRAISLCSSEEGDDGEDGDGAQTIDMWQIREAPLVLRGLSRGVFQCCSSRAALGNFLAAPRVEFRPFP